MNKIEALEKIKETWDNPDIKLSEKITEISNLFYSVGLDLPGTAQYIKATPAELDALLSLGGLNEDIIKLISDVNPPETTWTLLANAGDDEIKQALKVIKSNKSSDNHFDMPLSEYVYQQMLEVAGPSPERRVGLLSGEEIRKIRKKGEDFNALSDWEVKFLKSLASQKKLGKTLSQKQSSRLLEILNNLADKGAIKRDSIDGDQELCNKVLDAIGR